MLVKKWDGDGVLKISDFADSLNYFRNRYSAEGSLTHHFRGLRLRPSDQPELVEAVITGKNTNPKDSVAALLIIVYRLRNNLFHGEKWEYRIQDQQGNFTHANAALIRALEYVGV
jgi:hypothetical protein